MSEHTKLPWFVGAQNDILYIINRPPRPSRDDIVDIPDVQVVATMNACMDAANAEFAVKAVNNHDALIEALKMARARIDYLGAVCPNPKHYESNADTFLPRIDFVLREASSVPTHRDEPSPAQTAVVHPNHSPPHRGI